MEKLLEFCKGNFTEIEDIDSFGSGGQKEVFSGVHREHGKVVLKLIELHSDSTAKRAIRELEITANLEGEYPKIFGYDFITFGKTNYIYVIEQLIEGQTLRSYMNKNTNIAVSQVINIGSAILKSLEKVHESQLVHRDIKPENIIVTEDSIVLLDFGIARDLSKESLTADLAFFGPMTVGYAAPEQIKNQKKIICNRTDLFAWGIIMYEMVKGYNPFTIGVNSREEIILNTLNLKVPKLKTGKENFDEIISKCLEKAVHRRPASVFQVKEILAEERY
ncbi:serine/threonine-protein kinase [Priestia megaterium]